MSEPNFMTDKELFELISTNFRFDKESFWEQLSIQGMLPPIRDNWKAVTRVAKIENQLTKGDTIWLEARVLDSEESCGLRTGLRVQIGGYWNLTLRGNENVHLGEKRCWVVKLANGEYFASFTENIAEPSSDRKWRATKFTEKERAHAVALLVNGEVEEL